jgi:hypothetical protein
LKAVTTRLLPGYLQSNGVPYSGRTTLTETFQPGDSSPSAESVIVTTIVEDPMYLTRSLVRTARFRKQPDPSGWNPTPCVVE